MSEAGEHFWQARRELPKPGDEDTLRLLSVAASEWREANRHFSAGYAMEWAAGAAWGDGEKLYSCIAAAIRDYDKCLETQSPCTFEALAALIKLRGALAKLQAYFSQPDSAAIPKARDRLLVELGQRLITCYENSPYAEHYLVTGVSLQGNLEGNWEPIYPRWEVPLGVELWSWSQRTVRINVPSAFGLFVELGDYQGANAVIECH